MKDLMNNIDVKCLIPPTAALTNLDTPFVSEIIDRRGFDSLTLVLVTGTNTDAGFTTVILVEEGDASNLSDNASVADADLIGTEVLSAFTQANDKLCRKIGYAGTKRYVRMTVTSTGNSSGDIFLAGVAILGHPTSNALAPNPPV